ncbi:MAG: hypothetical protein HY509_03955 [Acidobacteria bacterium]|nr:hypothetical protein [Acidobacteriota bacterium]
MFSIDDERLDGLIGRVEGWFLAFIVLFFVTDAALTYRFARTIPGWLLQVLFSAGLVFPLSYAFGYLVFQMVWRLKVSKETLRALCTVLLAILGLFLIGYLVAFAFRPGSYATGLFGLVVPLGFAGATIRFWNHDLR